MTEVWLIAALFQMAYIVAAVLVGKLNFGRAAGTSWIGALLRLLQIIAAVIVALIEHLLLATMLDVRGALSTALMLAVFACLGWPVTLITVYYWVSRYYEQRQRNEAAQVAQEIAER